MRPPRGSLGLLMAGIAVAALDLAVFRALWEPGTDRPRYLVPVDATHVINPAGLALGVLPMASLLLLVAAKELPGVLRRGACSGFGLGFLLAGWPAVFLFLALAALSPAGFLDYFDAVIGSIGAPLYEEFGPSFPDAWWAAFEVAAGAAALTMPEVLVATLGGWLVRRGMRIRADRAGVTAGDLSAAR